MNEPQLNLVSISCRHGEHPREVTARRSGARLRGRGGPGGQRAAAAAPHQLRLQRLPADPRQAQGYPHSRREYMLYLLDISNKNI